MALSIDELSLEYASAAHDALTFCDEVKGQLEKLLASDSVTLGVPIEYRVKEWHSIAEKIERKALDINSILEVSDLAGLRLILLFKRDVDKTCELINQNFKVISAENPQDRLSESQFGYQSHHFQVRLLDEWLAVPSLNQFGSFQAEIQVRTLAQHIWAQASHFLQYKNESGVPYPVKRAINRVSALLETADLEFERVLDERESYVSEVDPTTEPILLNVDLLEKLLDAKLPQKNKADVEPYAELLEDLYAFEVKKYDQLEKLIEKHVKAIEKSESEFVEKHKTITNLFGHIKERIDQGVFLTHVGLTRTMLQHEFGERWDNYKENR